MEIDISRVLYKRRHLTYEAREWEKVMCLLRKAAGAQPPHNLTCFSQGQHSKDIQLQDRFFFSEEASCLAVISQAIFSDGALKT